MGMINGVRVQRKFHGETTPKQGFHGGGGVYQVN